MTKSWHNSRRTALKGLGTALALPWLEPMTPLTALSAPARTPPRCMAFLYVPNGKNMAEWTPKTEGRDFELPSILEPLESLQDDLLVLSGLTCDKARPNGDGPGDHARAMAAFLTGCQARKTSGANIKAGTSADQLAAQKIGHRTKFPSLEIGCEGGRQAGNCDSGYSCAYSSNLSWRGDALPMVKETDPRQVFERLFANQSPGETAESRARRERTHRSILDFVADDARRLHDRLGRTDQRKLDEYLTAVREIELRLERLDSGPEPVVEQPAGLAGMRGIPKDYEEHLRLMCDMLVLAFQTDQTRIATFVLANEGSNRSYRHIGVAEGHHDLSHHGRNAEKLEKIRQINRFHIMQLAYLAERLKMIPEGDGTVLDNCMMLYGNGDGNRHNHDDLPILLVGRGGGTLQTGRHVRFARETPLTNLYIELLDRMGVQVERIGDSTGRLAGLAG